MTHDECRETLALHALGSVGASERQALESHLHACSACSGELAELRETAASLALLAPPMAPPPEHLERLLVVLDAADEPRRQIARESTEPVSGRPARERRRWRPLVFAVRLAVAAAVVLLLVSRIALLRRLDAAHLQIESMRAIGSFVTSSNVSVVPLWGARATRVAHAKLAYDRTTGRFVLFSTHLPPPPEGERYQLWVIAEGIRPAGAFLPESPGGVLRAPPRGDELFLFAVSIEPSAEVDEPTGPMVLMSDPLRNPR